MKKRTEGGFTLLEVLAAVAILGIWFSVLASIAIQGQRSEGETERRIRASLIADRVLLDLELGFEDGVFPQEELQESEEDEFAISVESKRLAESELIETDPFFQTLMAGDLAQLATDLYQVHVRVAWTEGFDERRVERFTYAWDSAPLQQQIEESLRNNPQGLPAGSNPAAGQTGQTGQTGQEAGAR